MNVSLLLYDLQSPVNLGQILRVAETFQIPVQVYDPRSILTDANHYPTISDFSCGAYDRLTSARLLNAERLKDTLQSKRIIATALTDKAITLPQYVFQDGDVILLGNEYDGLPQSVMDNAAEKLYIPLPSANLPKPRSFSPIDKTREESVAAEGIPNLSVSMTAAIIAYEIYAQKIKA
ncbi:MAG: hypothetical protein EB059_04565 [Alphaproteobacteria bacterium]|nr:hypothetical protein [Alphaproteobacteria bacterium]